MKAFGAVRFEHPELGPLAFATSDGSYLEILDSGIGLMSSGDVEIDRIPWEAVATIGGWSFETHYAENPSPRREDEV